MVNVMYFDQRTHAWASVHMVENNKKRLKIIQKVLSSSYAREAHVSLTKEYKFTILLKEGTKM